LDISDRASIEKAYEIVADKTDVLDAVINMPGILKVGSLVELPLEELKQVMEINLFGMYAINKQFLPLILNAKGRIINLSSEVGTQMAAPFNGFYAISKHAVEAYSDALRRELAFLGIKVIKIQPGPIKTQMTKSAEEKFIEAAKASVLFKKHIAKGLPYLPKVYQNAQNAEVVARAILKAVNDPKPRIAYSVKKDKIRQMLDLLPVSWADLIIKKALS
jgi:short-subunit dehydrogenase